jgi:hypothetical protein
VDTLRMRAITRIISGGQAKACRCYWRYATGEIEI